MARRTHIPSSLKAGAPVIFDGVKYVYFFAILLGVIAFFAVLTLLLSEPALTTDTNVLDITHGTAAGEISIGGADDTLPGVPASAWDGLSPDASVRVAPDGTISVEGLAASVPSLSITNRLATLNPPAELPHQADPASVKALRLSVETSAKPCAFSIRLRNVGHDPVAYLDTLGKKTEVAGLPGTTWIRVRDREDRIISGPANEPPVRDGDRSLLRPEFRSGGVPPPAGYTFLYAWSEIEPDSFKILKPGEETAFSYSLDKLALGLFSRTHAKTAEAGTYQFQLVTVVYLNSDRTIFLEARTPWQPFPRCLIGPDSPTAPSGTAPK
jgi:hypothetical protein